MSPFADKSAKTKAMAWLRWLAALPAAMLCGFAVRYGSGLLIRLAEELWRAPEKSNFVFYVGLLLSYVCKDAVFVVVGARVAPHRRLAVSLALAAAAVLASFVVHLSSQSHVGATNYTHFAAESIGAAFGVAYVLFLEQRRPGGD